ncbi:DUF1887 family CARF protein [Methylomicrobium sp. Wu6]|uniref:Card1-like endonuclease domain-containing protein n=1 Tax=Methylomicrobium sp. Wu6 TaxID=3107928 RepID=UPI002DD66E60|nr:DUF1887 family CARF protein [Methylomicrobium sp. Wu6]MEC4748357.1 DUF1887 family CARF protein [Methylomicrobium sp. Wu6]
MTINTHLILVSAQPIPNITPILDDSLRPQKVVMLVSAEMIDRSQALESIFKPRGIRVERCLIDNPWDAEHISDKILDLLALYPDGDIALNATGGTKLMSIAAYEAFRSCQLPIYYIHPEQDQLLWLSPKQPAQELADRLKLKDYLMAYGAEKVEIPDSTGVIEPIRQLTQQIIADIDRYAPELGSLNYLALNADNPRLSVEIDQGPQSKPQLWQLLELFEQAGLCRINGHTLTFFDEPARFTANGGWLEMHTYAECLKLKKNLGIQDNACNITITRQPAGKAIVKNEIDIGLIKANRLHIIECKTKSYRDFAQGADVLYKLDSLRDLMGGLQGRAMLVSFKALDKTSRARAKELSITLCCQSELKNLQQHLQKWLGQNS